MRFCGEMALKIRFSEQRQMAEKNRILASKGECRLAKRTFSLFLFSVKIQRRTQYATITRPG